MNKYKLAYIDESREEIEKFQRFCFPNFEVIPIYPKPSKEDTCSEILANHVDAVVSDFEFSEQMSDIKYDGTDLTTLILKKREGFPVFILTSFEDEAMRKGDDVNIIYEKGEKYTTDDLGNTSRNEKLLERIKLQIDKYKHKLEVDEKRLLELIAESKKRRLNAFEMEELAQLDSQIEKALDKESRIPNILRDDKEAHELGELLKKVDELAKKLDEK
jgi:HPt (histidine-containing phosphotransfer) domain-containing protein